MISRPSGAFEPLALLITFGLLMGSIVAVANYALSQGAHVLTLAFHQFLLSGGVLYLVCLLKKQPVPISRRHLAFYIFSGVLGMAGPHVLLFLLVSKLGAGFASMACIFPPLFTYAMALIVGMERFQGVRVIGLALGMLGSLWIIISAGRLSGEVSAIWLGLLYLIPFIMAWGNIYRTLKWPKGLGNLEVTAAVLCVSAALLVIPAFVADPARAILSQPIQVTAFTFLQATLTGSAYLVFFRLQTVGGPVYLSQAGYVITGTGLFYGLAIFGERYAMGVWLGFGVAVSGVLIVTLHQALGRKAKSPLEVRAR